MMAMSVRSWWKWEANFSESISLTSISYMSLWLSLLCDINSSTYGEWFSMEMHSATQFCPPPLVVWSSPGTIDHSGTLRPLLTDKITERGGTPWKVLIVGRTFARTPVPMGQFRGTLSHAWLIALLTIGGLPPAGAQSRLKTLLKNGGALLSLSLASLRQEDRDRKGAATC